ncbi:N-acetylglucosamine-induced protein 1 [Candida parapsilosis]|uniref:Uncharacterized protein n=2 Tax=Candida parapsilosis TaxID=5480 RepID=G8B877_CANPC|nr:uncharacterized protein CPAR2_106970 [Candida parapsilosis]KAF6043028.1 N-acetylglucosamine-induced protein 1 [Candida parapsilosis]KAF6049394.1 N-acetylglucosamine-induced protein 1 [Candida parapsilosis]KAF6057245.1 N-acetylglucosamine-induced protein 1 [Candida parapsilosis]KAF6066036.1 N-acetylglucosamine-induced protein 1 [Candida parapsilosis]KAI5904398.1 N-acetylglucosamine-induced protein 1 [Candida parapsilosis]
MTIERKVKTGDPFTWAQIQQIVKSNKLELFARSEEQFRNYYQFKNNLSLKSIALNDYVLNEELEWKQDDIRSQTILKSQEYSTSQPQDLILYNDDDVKIIYNKFPYYFEDSVVHLCIWSKLTIPNDVNSPVGDISPLTKRIIERYLQKTFIEKGVSPDDILWFRNWSSLQSVKSVSHIHVLLHDVDGGLLHKLLGSPGNTLTLEDYKELLDERE